MKLSEKHIPTPFDELEPSVKKIVVKWQYLHDVAFEYDGHANFCTEKQCSYIESLLEDRGMLVEKEVNQLFKGVYPKMEDIPRDLGKGQAMFLINRLIHPLLDTINLSFCLRHVPEQWLNFLLQEGIEQIYREQWTKLESGKPAGYKREKRGRSRPDWNG